MMIKKVDILEFLFERLEQGAEKDYTGTLVFGLAAQPGGLQNPVAITIIKYTGDQSLELAVATIPSGLSLIGIVEFGNDKEEQELYSRLAKVRDAFLFKVCDGNITVTTGADYKQKLHLNVVTPEQFWGKTVCTFRIQGKFLIDCILEFPDLKKCFDKAKERVFNQAAYTIGKKSDITILPRWGHLVSEIPQVIKPTAKVMDIMLGLKHEIEENRDASNVYFCPTMSLINVKLVHDQSKSTMTNNSAALIVSDKIAWCKLFRNYVDIDALVIVPSCMKGDMLYRKFNLAVSSQLQFGFYSNIVHQLGNSISAEKPQVYHLWPWFSQHFVTVLYPQNTFEWRLNERCHKIFELYFAGASLSLFWRSEALFQPIIGLISPHASLRGKFSETETISGHYEYRHYMQEDFNDDLWGCAYRSLQTICSWFRLQGYTAFNVPNLLEIQQSLVNIGIKNPNFIGSNEWIRPWEVSVILKSFIRINCLLLAMDDGVEMKSTVPILFSHFKGGGAPVLIGKGDKAFTVGGISRDPDSDFNVNYLVLDPHYTGKDEIKTVLSKGVVSWKDGSFRTKEYHQICIPLTSSVPIPTLASNVKGIQVVLLGNGDLMSCTIGCRNVKKTEKGFKRKQEWTLSSLKEINYKSKESLEFDLQLEKSYHWLSQSAEEKDVFFALLHQICSRMHRPPKFLNFQIDEEDEASRNENIAIVSVSKDTQMIESGDEEFGLTEREEFDLEKVLGRAENAVVNAEAFMEQLAKELSILDGENIHSIMDSEAQVNSLMDSIDKSICQLEEIEKELVDYEDAVTHVKSAVEKIEEENSQMGTAAKNNQHLLSELTNLIRALDFPVGSQILNADFNSVEGIAKATKDAYALKDALNIEENIHPALLKMRSVTDQKRRLEKFKQKFSQNLMSHLAKLFIHHGNISSMDNLSTVNTLRLPVLNSMYNELTPYTKLMGWLKVMDSEAYGSLLKTYTLSIQKIYEKNVRVLFEEARTRISGSATTSGKLSGSTNDLRIRGRFFGKTRSLANREGDTESQGSGEGSVDSSERQHFYDILEQLLEGLEPSVNNEEKFIATFFCLEIGSSSSGNVSIVSPSKGSAGGELRRIMSSLFSAIESELNSFLTHYEKVAASFCMGAMVRLGNHALKAENTSTYIGMIFGSVLVQEKRSFDRLMNSYVQAINDSRLPRKAKPGILAFVTDFEDFAVMAESIFGNSARRSDLEKWYVKMLTAVFDGIMRLAAESGKTPGEVIRMENFHRLHSILSRLKVPALEQQKKDAKIKYNEALNGYVTKYFGRPLIKLNEFFEGVQAKVSQGVKESEIGYQMAFSRAELKRVIKEYPAKEVKKGLESLYRKVEKHLSEDENLLQVVWRAMQEEFIVQYKSIESLIGRFYPGSKITLEFTIDDILLFFSEIAQSH